MKNRKLVLLILTLLVIILSLQNTQETISQELKTNPNFIILDIFDILSNQSYNEQLYKIAQTHQLINPKSSWTSTPEFKLITAKIISIHVYPHLGFSLDLGSCVDLYQYYYAYHHLLLATSLINALLDPNSNLLFITDFILFLKQQNLTGYYLYQHLTQQLPTP
jgi:hypothetical protein